MTRIEPPDWTTQPTLSIFRVTVADYTAIQVHRERILAIIQQEIEAYINDPHLCFDKDGFPLRKRLTGRYYIAAESYVAHSDPNWFQISIKCHCTETPKAGVDRDADYLGLEVWLKCLPGHWSTLEVYRNTDSSSI